MKITKQRLQQIIKEEVGRFTSTEIKKDTSMLHEQLDKTYNKLLTEMKSDILLEELLTVIPENSLLEYFKLIAEVHDINLDEEEVIEEKEEQNA